MRSLERSTLRESLAESISRIAAAYGFTSAPTTVSRKAASDTGNADFMTAVQTALISSQPQAKTPTQVWASARKGSGTTIAFSILGARHAIAHAMVVKTALSVAEIAGFTDLTVQISSIGDHESRRRFTRELASFFKKNNESLEPELRAIAAQDPDKAYHMLVTSDLPIRERLPRSIDYLSENSRKIMVDTISLFESVGISYDLEAHLSTSPSVHAELIFAITGTNKKGERSVIAKGGRFDELIKKKDKTPQGHATSMALTVPQDVRPDEAVGQPTCFVVHVGDAAKLRAFTLLEALWRANIAVREALMAESLREQMDKAKLERVPYVAIIGQREALDGTVLLRNTSSALQSSIPKDKLVKELVRNRR
jgi:histidyl-tRNA synthetase